MKIRGKEFKQIICLVLAVLMLVSTFMARDLIFSVRALTDELGITSEYVTDEGDSEQGDDSEEEPASEDEEPAEEPATEEEPSEEEAPVIEIPAEEDGDGEEEKAPIASGEPTVIDASNGNVQRFVSHTPNVSDDGVQSGEYASSLEQREVIKAEGAKKMYVSIEYGTYTNASSISYAWACVWDGDHPNYTANSNYSLSISDKIYGSHGVKSYVVDGDAVTIGFHSGVSNKGDGFGYYAVVYAVFDDEATSIPTWHKESNGSGTYAVVFDEGGDIFSFIDEADVLSKLGADKDKVTEIRLHKDTTGIYNQAFADWTSIEKVTSPDDGKLQRITPMAFYGCTSLKSIQLVGDGLQMDSHAFRGLTKLTDVSISGDGTTLGGTVFQNCTALTNVNLSGDGVKICSAFSGCTSLTDVTVSGTGTSIESRAFYNCSKLSTLDVGGWDMSEVTDISYAFYYCSSMKELDMSDWDTSAVTNMDNAFYYGPRRLILGKDFRFVGNNAFDSSYWGRENTNEKILDTELGEKYNANPTAMAGTYEFKEMGVGGFCYAFRYSNGDLEFQYSPEPDANGRTLNNTYFVNTSTTYGTSSTPWYSNRSSIKKVIFKDVIRPLRMNNWFYSMSNLTSFENMGNLDVSGVTSLSSTFYGCNILTSLDIGDWNVSHVTDMKYAFYNCYKLTELDLSKWETTALTDMSNIFYNCYGLTTLNVSTWDVSQVTDMNHGFYNCYKLTELDVSSWETTALTNMSYIFWGCYGLTELDVSKWQTTALTNMSYAFYNCHGLTELDVSSWETTALTDMSNIFYNCYGLTSLNVDNWDVSHVTNMNYAFRNCSGLTALDVSNWEITDKLTSMSYAFYGCYGVTELDLSKWDTSKVTSMSKAFSIGPRRITFGENFKFAYSATSNPFSPSYWRNTATNQRYLNTDLCEAYNADQESMAGTYVYDEMATGGDCFALLYENGDFVFQQAKEPKDNGARGNLIATYGVDTSLSYSTSTANNSTQIPWYAQRANVKKIVFADEILPISMAYWFYSMSNMAEIENLDKLNTDGLTSLNSTFNFCNMLTELDVSDWNMSGVTNMSNAFSSCSGLTELDVSNWDLSKVTNMSNAFSSCKGLTWLNTGNWKLPEVTSMSNMFYSCSSLISLDASNWGLEKVENMSRAFQSCSSLVILNSDNWNLASVTDMSYAFDGCTSLTTLNTGSWGLPKLKNLFEAFYKCSSLTELDTRNWSLASVTNMARAFYECTALTTLDTSNWDLSNVTGGTGSSGSLYQYGLESAFYGCSSLTALDTTNWKFPNAPSLYDTFEGCSSLTTLDVSNWDVSNVKIFANAFRDCSSLTALDVSGWNMSNATSLSYTFYNCSSLTTLDVKDWKLDTAKTINGIFYNCSSLTSLDVSNWKFPNVTELSSVFSGCSGLTELDVSAWDVSNVTTLSSTFYNCSGLTELNINGWNVSKVTSLSSTFSGCSGLKSLDLSSWDTKKVTSLYNTFYNCSGLTELNIKDWDVSGVTDMQRTFYGCSSLPVLDISGWDTSKVSPHKEYYADAYIPTSSVYTKHYSDLMGIRLGPDTDMQATAYLFELGEGQKAKWVREGTEDIMTVAEMRAYRRANPSTEPETWYRVRTITFNPNGGIAVPSSVGEWWPGKDFGELPTATRRGATFDGWWTELVGGERLHDHENPMQDTYYAHWREHKYTVILDSNDNTHREQSIELEYYQGYKLSSTIFDQERYVITGWSTRPDGTGTTYGANEEIIALTEEDGDIIYLYAMWTSLESIATITFDSDGGTDIAPRQMERGKTLASLPGKLPTPLKSGYSFVAWHIKNDDGSLGDVVDESTVVSGDMILIAEWKKDLTVEFDYNLGITSTTITRIVPYGNKVGELPEDIYYGRKQALIGWFTAPDGGDQIDENTVITEDITFYAHWGWRPRFNANGGKFTNPSYQSDYEIQDDSNYYIEKFPEVSYDGYRLVGWYHGDYQVNEGDTVDLSKGTEIYARWERADTVKITLMANGGIITNANNSKTYEMTVYEVYAGKRVAELPIPTRTGYEFLGWEDLTGQVTGYCDRDSVFYQNATLIARWIEQDCTVTFDAVEEGANFYNTSAIIKTIKVPNGYTVNTLPGCSLKDHILEGWYTGKDGTGDKLTKKTKITGDITYYANWVPFSTTKDDELHKYTYGVEWYTASSANVDNCGNNLEFHPTDYRTQEAVLHINFEVNDVYGETKFLPKNSIYIRVPEYIFFDEDGNDLGTNNITEWLAKYPEIGREKFSYIYNEKEKCYYLVNNQPLDTGGLDIYITYSVNPYEVEGGAINKDNRYVDGYDYFQNTFTIGFGINETPNEDKIPDTWEEKNLSIEMHTQIKTTATKSFSSFVYTWNNSWGARPDDADDYFYIIWHLSETYNSYTNQPSTFKWSEDETVHDGTIVYMSSDSGKQNGHSSSTTYTCTVVTKHPVELLKDVPSVGRTFYNEAIVTETWEKSGSGYITQHRVNASATIYPDDYGRGEFDKVRSNARLISGGQEDILDDHKEIYMPWSLYYDGGSNVRPTWDEETKTYYAPNRTIRIRDGVQGDLMYSSGRASSKYIWEPNTGNINLSDDDYYFSSLVLSLTEYDSISESGVWSEKKASSDIGKYEPIEIWVRYKDTDNFVFLQSVNYTGSSLTVTLSNNKDVVGFEVRHASSFYWTYLSIKANMYLVPTQKIMTLVQSDVDARTTSLIKNVAVCDIWLTDEGSEDEPFFHATNRGGDYTSAERVIYELNISSTNQYTKKTSGTLRKDSLNGTEDIPMAINGYNANPSGREKRIRSGVFYDLLPPGTTVDPTTVYCLPIKDVSASSYDSYLNSSQRLDTALYNIKFEEDWQGSGRTMMIIDVAVPNDIKTTGISVLYLLRNTYENIRLNGVNVTNDVAFINTSKDRVWPDSVSGSITNGLPADDRGFYEDLLLNNEGFIGFAQASAKYETPSVSSWGFTKMVKTNAEFKVSDSTLPGKNYTYMLSYSQSASTKSNNIVLYDILEQSARRRDDNGNVTDRLESAWHGTFVSVDVVTEFDKAQASELKWTVYYSTVPRDKFDLEPVKDPKTYELCDLTNPEYWSTEVPDDKSTITAIAVDFSKDTNGEAFTMDGKGTLDIYITMQAPKDAEGIEDLTAYNEGTIYTQQITMDSVTPLFSDAQVTLKDVNPELEKSSDPESGTEEAPKIVEYNEQITYTLKVTNTEDEFILYDTVVEDEVPEGLNVLAGEIMVHFGDPDKAVLLSTSPRVGLVRDGQKLTFTIYSLLPEETIYLVIPAIVKVTRCEFKNSATITEVNGVDKDIKSGTTYHEVVPSTQTELEITKIMSGRADPIQEGEFNFLAELIAIDGKAVTAEQKEVYTGSTGGASGWVSFGPIKYGAETENHTYRYKITEIAGTDKHISYFDGAIYVEVKIVDTNPGDEKNPRLVANKTYYSDEACTQPIEGSATIENKFVDGADLEITKVVAGETFIIKEGDFSFTAVQVDNDTLQPIEGGKGYHGSTVDSDGRVTFEPIPYDSGDAGKTYTFRITEDEGDIPQMKYSDEVIYAKLTITLEEDNSLTYTVTYFTVSEGNVRNDIESPTITNTYNPASLPEMGGMGTAPYMIGGALLILSAMGMAFMAYSKRSNTRKKKA